MARKKRKAVRLGSRLYEEVILTQSEAESSSLEWQKVLGLQDWGVSVEIKRQSYMGLPESQGTMATNPTKRFGQMELLDPEDYGNGPIPQDMEKTVVHELLHIALEPLKIPKEREDELELFIEQISSALVALKRRKQ